MINGDKFARKETSFEGRALPIEKISFPIEIKHTQVVAFAKAMDDVLTKNDHKGGWDEGQCTIKYLQSRLVEEMGEYFSLLAMYADERGILPPHVYSSKKELLDIANFAMMLWDRSKE
jgi:hypothetical protein